MLLMHRKDKKKEKRKKEREGIIYMINTIGVRDARDGTDRRNRLTIEMEQKELESKFSFTYIAPSTTPHNYECKNFDELLQKTSSNPLLKLEGVEALFLEDIKNNIPLRSYIRNPPPFDIKKLNLVDNLAHIWLYQAYFLDANALLPRRPQKRSEIETINIIDDIFITRDKEHQMILQTMLNIFPRGIDAIVANYFNASDNHTRFINGLIQLYFYISENSCGRQFNSFNLRDWRCDRTLFVPTGFAFEPLTYLFHCVQKTGFTTYSLSTYCLFDEQFRKGMDAYKKISGTEEIEISFKRLVYDYEIATGKPGDYILERDKQQLLLIK